MTTRYAKTSILPDDDDVIALVVTNDIRRLLAAVVAGSNVPIWKTLRVEIEDDYTLSGTPLICRVSIAIEESDDE